MPGGGGEQAGGRTREEAHLGEDEAGDGRSAGGGHGHARARKRGGVGLVARQRADIAEATLHNTGLNQSDLIELLADDLIGECIAAVEQEINAIKHAEAAQRMWQHRTNIRNHIGKAASFVKGFKDPTTAALDRR